MQMKLYKVVGNTTPEHSFKIDTIVQLKQPALTRETGVFGFFDGEPNQPAIQVVGYKDVECMDLTHQQATEALSDMADAIQGFVSEAEEFADNFSLSFDLVFDKGFSATYYGEGHEFAEKHAYIGWNPHSEIEFEDLMYN